MVIGSRAALFSIGASDFLFLVGIYVRLRGACGTHHRVVACLCRALYEALTVSDHLLRSRDKVFDARLSLPAMRDQLARLRDLMPGL